MNLPNLLTISRFFLIPVYIAVFLAGNYRIAFLVMVIAGVTDVLDGYIARKRKQITQLGSMLDPLADKSMALVVVLSLLYAEKIPLVAAFVLLIREVGMIVSAAFFHFRGKKSVPANFMGKISTVLFYLAIMLVVFDVTYAIPFLWFVIGFSFVTTFIYTYQFFKLNRQFVS